MNTRKTEAKRYFDILNGPGRDALFDACKYACSKTAKLPIDLTVATGYTMPKDHPGCAYFKMPIADIRITGIEHEDGSGCSFNLHGYCKCDPDSLGGNNVILRSHRFRAYYNSKSRKGCITFE